MSNPKILCLPPVADTLRDLDMRFTWVLYILIVFGWIIYQVKIVCHIQKTDCYPLFTVSVTCSGHHMHLFISLYCSSFTLGRGGGIGVPSLLIDILKVQPYSLSISLRKKTLTNKQVLGA